MMNPINDEMPAKECNVENLQDLDTSNELLNENNNKKDNSEMSNEGEITKNDSVNICDDKEKQAKLTNTEGSNEDSTESNVKSKETIVESVENKEYDTPLEESLDEATKDTNKTEDDVTDADVEEEVDEFEDVEDVEDLEIPDDEEFDEIIVPDEAEAEDLTDDKDDVSRSLNEDEEVDGEEDNEIDNSVHYEETTKSSAAIEKDEHEISLNDDDSDKKTLNNDEQEDICSKDYEDIENIPIEPELVAIEEGIKDTNSQSEGNKSNDANLNEDSTSQATYDPLNCTDNQEQNKDNENSVENNEIANDDEEEDDEVQFVETRNSPICIESDEDEIVVPKDTTKSRVENSIQTITTATATVNVPKSLTVTRTSARKSTAKPQQMQKQPQQVPGKKSPPTVSKVQNKPKSFNYLQKASIFKRSSTGTPSTERVVDCIDLLDSSDEESPPSRKSHQQQQRTPQKRTLLAAKGNYYKTNNKSSSPGSNNRLPTNFSPNVRQQVRKPAPPPLPPPTPQSNFLNAVQLQPASVTGPNPPAFSALLSNKSVIIPNAFYGNPPGLRGTGDTDVERRYARWLENFLNQFCKPQFVATHSCLVFLQRALKYKDFVRIKTLRTNMNSHAQTANGEINANLMADMRTILLKNSKKITNFGRRLCELTCSSVPGKAVALMAHGISGKVTLKTCNMDVPKATNAPVSSTSTSSSASTNALTRKRQLEEDEDEYTPDKSKLKTLVRPRPPSENGDEDSGEMGDDRKRSLRTKRTKRIDNSFSYNEDDLVAEYEIDDEDDEKLAQVEIQRKIEQKRLEAQRQRQQQAKSFESAFIQAFAKSIDGPTTSSRTKNDIKNQRIRLKNNTTATTTSIRHYMANNDAEDLLQATWIENVENDDTQVISDDDEPKEHRIYKQQKQKLQQQQQQDYYSPPTKLPARINTNPSPKISAKVPRRSQQEEIITGDDDYDENNIYSNNQSNVDPHFFPKNVDPHMHVNGKNKDRCVVCNLNCQRLVHHYVNEHRGCEVYNSRLSTAQLKLLKQGNCTNSNVSLYKNGQFQYEAYCIFCQKQSRFMLPYWYQHFTMHTGEYAYRCSGCHIRKPTRSLLTQHHAQGCPDDGNVIQDYAHDSKSSQIEARICTICNFVQLHRSNIVKHLHQQHNIKQILPKYIQTIVLMKTKTTLLPVTTSPSTSGHNKRSLNTPPSYSQPSASYEQQDTYIIDDDENDVQYEEILPEETSTQTSSENHYYNYIPPYMQAAVNSGNFSFEQVDAGEDLSFMICGMLDVQMNSDAN